MGFFAVFGIHACSFFLIPFPSLVSSAPAYCLSRCSTKSDTSGLDYRGGQANRLQAGRLGTIGKRIGDEPAGSGKDVGVGDRGQRL